MNFAKKCKELRMKKAVTQEQMATALNLSSQAVSKWENGVTLPDIELLPEISVYFDVTIDELFNMTDEKHLDQIRNMVILQETIDDNDFDYAHNFLLSHIDTPAIAEVCLELLPALYNRKADEYRRKAEYFAKEALVRFPENHTNHANLNDAQQGMCGDWNLEQEMHLQKLANTIKQLHVMSAVLKFSRILAIPTLQWPLRRYVRLPAMYLKLFRHGKLILVF